MSECKYILQEVPCAPNAVKQFSVELKKLTGFSIASFKKSGEFCKSAELVYSWKLGAFVLSYSFEDPYYKLEKIDMC